MREARVTIAGNSILVREHTVGDLRKKVLPAIADAFTNINLNTLTLAELTNETDRLFEVICKVVPDVTIEMLDQAYMSELEDLITKWVDVNFMGLKTLAKRLASLQAQRPS